MDISEVARTLAESTTSWPRWGTQAHPDPGPDPALMEEEFVEALVTELRRVHRRNHTDDPCSTLDACWVARAMAMAFERYDAEQAGTSFVRPISPMAHLPTSMTPRWPRFGVKSRRSSESTHRCLTVCPATRCSLPSAQRAESMRGTSMSASGTCAGPAQPQPVAPDPAEFRATRWWSLDELRKVDPSGFDPNLPRFINKLDREQY